MKILFLQSTSEIGGSDVSLLRLVESLDRGRFSPAAALPEEGFLAGRLRALGCRTFILPEMLKLTTRLGWGYLGRYAFNYPRAVLKLAALIRREGIDLVHTNSLHNLYGFSAAALAGRGHVWHARELSTESRLLARAEALLARGFSRRVIAVSGAAAALFGGRAQVLPNSIDLGRFRPGLDGRPARREWGFALEAPVIGIVGRLDRGKGVDLFLKAAARVARRFPAARFAVVGGPIRGQEKLARELDELSFSLSLSSAVCFTGWRHSPEEMPEVYAALDVVVSAARKPEGFGLAVLEAMACGRPVVAARHGGPLELCEEGRTALFFEPGDADGLAEALGELLSDPARRRALGEAGRLRAERLYSRDEGARRLARVYEETAA